MLSRRIFFTQLIVIFMIKKTLAKCQQECKNGGTCYTGYNDCYCPPGFTGPVCEVESVGLCSNNDVTNGKSLLLITFGSGSAQYSTKTPSSFNFSTSHQQKFESEIDEGWFGFVNAVPKRCFTIWQIWHDGALDHTENDIGGYMYLVNVDANDRELFKSTVNNLCIGLRYEFSAYLVNIIPKGLVGSFVRLNPNIRFEVRTATNENQLLAQFSTDDISEYDEVTWSKYGLSFNASSSSVVLLIVSNVEGIWRGNDLAIDDIELRVCSTDDSVFSPSETTKVTITTMTTIEVTNTTVTTTGTTSEVEFTNLTSTTTSIMTTPQTMVERQTSISQPLQSFVPQHCGGLPYIGLYCNESSSPCDILKPCQQNGTCHNTDTTDYGYNCLCLPGFNGTRCEFDHRPCKPHTCLDRGICNETENGTFNCTCDPGWQGIHCESMINFCENVTCMNNGVCRPLLLNYTCECLGDNYFGRHCEFTAKRITILKTVSTSFAYVAIIAMASVAMFIVIMDILKYCFGIDPVRKERERLRRKKEAKKPKPRVIQRFVYVNAPLSSDVPTSTTDDTTT